MRVLHAAAITGAMLLAATDVAQAAPCDGSLVGTWSANVILSDNPSYKDQAVISFTAGGHVCLSTPVSAGDGNWWSENGHGVGWAVKEVFQPGPGYPGYVRIRQDGTVSGDTFTSSGQSQVFDQQGRWEKTVTAQVTATRTSTSPAASCT